MTQRQISHAAGEIPPCGKSAAHTPKHYQDFRAPHAGGGHAIECSACDLRTPKSASFDFALQEWCRLIGVAKPAASTAARNVRAIR